MLTELPAIQRVYNIYCNFYIRLSRKPIPLLGDSFDSIVEAIKLLHDVSEVRTNQFATYHLHFKKKLGIIESAYNSSFLLSPYKQISPFDSLFHVPEASIIWFATYHLYYKKKLKISEAPNEITNNPTWTFICIMYCLYSLFNLGNFSTTSLFICNGNTYVAEPRLIVKKKELPRSPSIKTTNTWTM